MRKKNCMLIAVVFLLLVAAIAIALLVFRSRYDKSKLIQIVPPNGTQLMIFPIENGVITAGYRNPTYLHKNHFEHYGVDITASNGGYAEILASGDGVVLGTEFCDNSLGNIVVIQYDNVYVPDSKNTVSLIARYYHMDSIKIKKDDTVHTGQIIGTIDGKHKWYHHIHIEFDTDTQYPFCTPQVAESTSKLLQRSNATGELIIEPIDALVVRQGQRVHVHPNSDCCTEKDKPRFTTAKN